VKLLELSVNNLHGVLSGTYRFGDPDGAPRELVVFSGETATARLEAIVAVLEAIRAAARPRQRRDLWALHRWPKQARLRATWRLSAGEAARVGAPRQTLTSEWRFGPGDDVPREVRDDDMCGGLPRHARAELATYCYLGASRHIAQPGAAEADPLAEMLAEIARRDVLATRAYCRVGVGLVGWSTPDTLVEITQTVARIFPSLGLERVACSRGEAPVACSREGRRVELAQLAEDERDAIHIAAALATASAREGVVLIDRPKLPASRAARDQWLDWLVGVAESNQLFVAIERPPA
jgi:hypothetical protein